MKDFIDSALTPFMWFLGEWSLRHCVVVAVAGLWLALTRSRQASARLAVCRLALIGTLALPLIPASLNLPVLPSMVESTALSDQEQFSEANQDTLPTLAPTAPPPGSFSHDARSVAPVIGQPVHSTPEAAAAPLGWDRIGILLLMLTWVFGALFCAFRFLAGALWIAALRREAVPVSSSATKLFDTCRRQLRLRRPLKLLMHDALTSPVFVGPLRCAILVPLDWERSPREVQHAVLLHELTHAARRDDVFKLVEESMRAIFFFHPLLLWLLGRTERYREESCDAAAVRAGTESTLLARILLEFGQQQHRSRLERPMQPALPFLRNRIQLHRINQLLREDQRISWAAPTSRRQLVGLAIVTAVALAAIGSIGLGAADPSVAPPESASQIDSNDGPVVAPMVAQLAVAAQLESTEEDDPLEIRGRVVNPNNKPVAGALVELHRDYGNSWHGANELHPYTIYKATADGAGEFRLEIRKSMHKHPGKPDDWHDLGMISAAAPGFGPGVTTYGTFVADKLATVRLVPDEPIEGQIVNLENQPIAGVRVKLFRAERDPATDDLKAWVEGLAAGKPRFSENGMPQLRLQKVPLFPQVTVIETVTDADGRFQLGGVGRGRRVLLKLRGGGIVASEVEVVTLGLRPKDFIELAGKPPVFTEASQPRIYGSHFRYAAEPSQPIEGIVQDTRTKEPLAGVRILAERFAGAGTPHWPQDVAVISDAQGRYRLEGLPKGNGNRLVVQSKDLPYFLREIDVPGGNGLDPVKLDIHLNRGIWISGRVLASEGKPVDATIVYLPWPGNPHGQGLSELHNMRLNSQVDLLNQRYLSTDSDGAYRIVGLPGRGIVQVIATGAFPPGQGMEKIADLPKPVEFNSLLAPRPNYITTAIKEVQVAETEQEKVVEFELKE